MEKVVSLDNTREVRCDTELEDGEKCDSRLFDTTGRKLKIKCRGCGEIKEYDLFELIKLSGNEILDLMSR